MSPFTVETGDSAAFVTTPDDPIIDPRLIEYVSTFVPKASGEHFNPHVTTGVALKSDLDQMLAEPFEEFTFSPIGAAVYQLGQFGTAAKKLKELDFEIVSRSDGWSRMLRYAKPPFAPGRARDEKGRPIRPAAGRMPLFAHACHPIGRQAFDFDHWPVVRRAFVAALQSPSSDGRLCPRSTSVGRGQQPRPKFHWRELLAVCVGSSDAGLNIIKHSVYVFISRRETKRGPKQLKTLAGRN